MKNSTIIYYIALISFICALLVYNSFPKTGEWMYGISLGCVISNLLINFRKEVEEK